MRRRRRNSGARFNVSAHIESEVLGEVRPRPVIGYDLSSAIGRHLPLPLLIRFRQSLLKILLPLLEVGPVGWIHFSQLSRDTLGYTAAIIRVRPIMRVAQRVNVPFRAGDGALRDLQNLGELGCIQISRRGRLDISVAALSDQ